MFALIAMLIAVYLLAGIGIIGLVAGLFGYTVTIPQAMGVLAIITIIVGAVKNARK